MVKTPTRTMGDEPNSIWKKSWKGPLAYLGACALVTIEIVAALLAFGVITRSVPEMAAMGGILIGAVIGGLLTAWLLTGFFRWLFSKGWRRILLRLGCFAGLVALFYAVEDWRGWHAWNGFKKEWEAKGERFDRQSVIPPNVPDLLNFAMSPIVQSSYGDMLTRSGQMIPFEQRPAHFTNRLKLDIHHDWQTNQFGSWAKGTKTDLAAWQNSFRALAARNKTLQLSPEPQSSAADVLEALRQFGGTIEELREAARLPYSRFPLEYDKDCPLAMLLPHLSSLKRCSQALALRSIAELNSSQSEKACDDLKLTFRLADSVRNEPVLISHLVRAALLQLVLQPIWEGLADHQWPERQLTALDAELATLDFLADYKTAMRGEMILSQIESIEYLRRHPEYCFGLFTCYCSLGNDRTTIWAWAGGRLIPSGWFYQNKLCCARDMVRFYLPAVDEKQQLVSPAAIRQLATSFEAARKHPNPYNVLEFYLFPSLHSSVRKFALAQVSVDMARVAIALERHRLAQGGYPESLDLLCPRFIKKIPHDVIGGRPLKYRREYGGQFVLYSVGSNEKDDGGAVGLSPSGKDWNPEEGDWVWRYPAK